MRWHTLTLASAITWPTLTQSAAFADKLETGNFCANSFPEVKDGMDLLERYAAMSFDTLKMTTNGYKTEFLNLEADLVKFKNGIRGEIDVGRNERKAQQEEMAGLKSLFEAEKARNDKLEERLTKLENNFEKKDLEISNLKKTILRQFRENKTVLRNERISFSKKMKERDDKIEERDATIKRQNAVIAKFEQNLESQNSRIENLETEDTKINSQLVTVKENIQENDTKQTNNFDQIKSSANTDLINLSSLANQDSQMNKKLTCLEKYEEMFNKADHFYGSVEVRLSQNSIIVHRVGGNSWTKPGALFPMAGIKGYKVENLSGAPYIMAGWSGHTKLDPS